MTHSPTHPSFVPPPAGDDDAEEALGHQAAHLDQVLARIMFLLASKAGASSSDLPLAQLRVCTLLIDGTWTVSALGREMGTTVSAMTQLIDRLEAAGMVERVSGETERRSRSVRLTEHGRSIMSCRRQRKTERARQALQALDVETRRTLVRSLDGFLAACNRALSGAGAAPGEPGRTRGEA